MCTNKNVEQHRRLMCTQHRLKQNLLLTSSADLNCSMTPRESWMTVIAPILRADEIFNSPGFKTKIFTGSEKVVFVIAFWTFPLVHKGGKTVGELGGKIPEPHH